MQKPVHRIHFLGICGTAMGAVAAAFGVGLPGELVDTGHKFFGTVSRGLASVT